VIRLKFKLLLICSLVLLFGTAQSGFYNSHLGFTACLGSTIHSAGSGSAIEIDQFPNSICMLEIVMPWGTTETVWTTGFSTMHVVFDGPLEGDANDSDVNGREEVPTEMVALSLTGTSPTLGSLNLRLMSGRPVALGQMEETVNSTPGVLDIPPFTPIGTADSFFNIFVEIEIGALGQTLHTEQPIRLSSLITHKPPAPDDLYENLEIIPLYNAAGEPTEFQLGAIQYKLNACGDAAHPYPIGDVNLDCIVNFFDFAMFSDHWQECTRPQCP